MRIEIEDNIAEILTKWNMAFETLDQAVKDGINRTLSEAYSKGIDLARERLYNPEGYAAMFYVEPTERRGDVWSGKLINVHQWAEAIEIGTSPHSAGPLGFRVGPDRPPYPWNMPTDVERGRGGKPGWRTFYLHHGAKAFNIFSDLVYPVLESLRMNIIEALRVLGGI